MKEDEGHHRHQNGRKNSSSKQSCQNCVGHECSAQQNCGDTGSDMMDETAIDRDLASSTELPNGNVTHRNVHGSMKIQEGPEVVEVFEEKSEKYIARACCDCMHITHGAIVVGVLQLLMLAGWLAVSLYYYLKIHSGGFLPFIGHAGGILVALGCLIAKFCGIAMEKPYLMWPNMIVEILGIAAGILLTILAVICMAAGTKYAVLSFGAIFGDYLLHLAKTHLGPIWPFVLAVIFDSGAAVGIWFYNLTSGCYQFICDKRFHQSNGKDKFFWHPLSSKAHKKS